MILIKTRIAELGGGVSKCADYVIAFLSDNAQGDPLGTALHESLSHRTPANPVTTQPEGATGVINLQTLQ